jgi:hypothetical protein
MTSCSECPRPAVARGLCVAHYQRQRRRSPLSAPLQQRGEGSVSLPGVRVTAAEAEQLEALARGRGVTLYGLILGAVRATLRNDGRKKSSKGC